MNFRAIARRAEKFVAKNSSLILTTIGVSGSVATAVLAGKASFKAAEIIREEQDLINLEEKSHPLDTKEKCRLVWVEYLPAVACGVLTIVSIVGINRVGARRAAILASAYSLTEKSLEEYRDHIKKTLGEEKEREVHDEVIRNRVRSPKRPANSEVIIMSGKVLCFDEYSGRTFMSDMEDLRAAVNDTNHQILSDYYASLTDFYERIGLEGTSNSNDIGWNVTKLVELHYRPILDKNRPCLGISFETEPITGFFRVQ